MTAVVAVAAANGAVCCKVRLYDTGCSLCSMALPKWASHRCFSQFWPFVGLGKWEWAACCFYSTQTPWLITLGNHKRTVSRENFRPFLPLLLHQQVCPQPSLESESESEGRQTPLFYVCMHVYNCVCLCVCVCRDPLPSYTHYRPFSLSHFRLMALYSRAGLAAGGDLAFDCLDAEHMWERTCSCPAESTSLSQSYKQTLSSSLTLSSHCLSLFNTRLYNNLQHHHVILSPFALILYSNIAFHFHWVVWISCIVLIF